MISVQLEKKDVARTLRQLLDEPGRNVYVDAPGERFRIVGVRTRKGVCEVRTLHGYPKNWVPLPEGWSAEAV
jgi:hypothetical protein